MNTAHVTLRAELEALTVDYWHDVDANGGVAAAAFYLTDGVYATTIREYRGREAIDAFYARRRDRGARVSLHLVNNFRLVSASAGRAQCQYVMSLLAADGVPVLPSRPAIMVASVEETLVQQASGAWLVESRRITPLFRDETPTTG